MKARLEDLCRPQKRPPVWDATDKAFAIGALLAFAAGAVVGFASALALYLGR